MFKQAVKHQAKLRLAIAGPSGSGKTFSSLTIATAMGGPIALVDTEHGSASKYADLFNFDVMEMESPFHPDRFVEAIAQAQKAGYRIIVLDSLSHAWSGPGGVLEIKEQFAKRREYNDYTAWGPAGQLQNRLVQAVVRSDLHVIATMRSKTNYSVDEVIEDGRKKTKITKQGMAPIQRDGFEYEFDVLFDMDVDNNAIVTKTRCPALTGGVFKNPGADVAAILTAWLEGEPTPPRPPADQPGAGQLGSGDNGAGSSNGKVTPKVQAWHRLRGRLEMLGADVTQPRDALRAIDEPWAVEALRLIAQEDWDGLVTLELA